MQLLVVFSHTTTRALEYRNLVLTRDSIPSTVKGIEALKRDMADITAIHHFALGNICPLPTAELVQPGPGGYRYFAMYNHVPFSGARVGAGERVLDVDGVILTTQDVEAAENTIRMSYGYLRVTITNLLFLSE